MFHTGWYGELKAIAMGGETIDGGPTFNPPLSDEKRVMARHKYGRYYIGDSQGNVITSNGGTLSGIMPGPVSGITPSGTDVFVTSTATNAFCNINIEGEQYNVVSNGEPFGGDPAVPKTKDGLIRIIDNRPKGGKLMYVTKKGIYSIDD